jgi:hypothetical protein
VSAHFFPRNGAVPVFILSGTDRSGGLSPSLGNVFGNVPERGVISPADAGCHHAPRCLAPLPPEGLLGTEHPGKQPAAVVRVVCAWCQREMGTKPCVPEQAGKVSHGICAGCSRNFYRELNIERRSK